MTKEITKAKILQEIQDKFALREFAPAKFLFEESVIPVYNVEQHLAHAEVKESTLNITAGPSSFSFFNIPWTERWRVHTYNVIFMTGVYGVTGLMVARRLSTEYIYIDMTAGRTTSYAVNLPKDIICNPGDSLRLYIDSFTSAGDLMLRLDTTVEEVR